MKWYRETALAALTAALVTGEARAGEAAANLLLNPGFEIETTASAYDAMHWKQKEPDGHGDCWGSAHREDWRSRSGFYLMAIRGTWAHAGDHGGIWQERPAQAGVRYEASVWTWSDPAWKPETQQLKLEFWSADASTKLGEEAISLRSPGESWAEQKLTATAPGGAAWVRLVVTVSAAGGQGALQLDDLSLRAADAGH